MEEKCLCEPTEILIFPCSGGSNVGQIANEAGVKLTQEDGSRFCRKFHEIQGDFKRYYIE